MLLSKTTTLVSAVQVAVKVTFAETLPVVGYVTPAWKTLVPSDQPAKVKPVRVNVFAGVVNVPPYVTAVGVVGPEPDPPVPAAYVIVCELAVHCANRFVSFVSVTEAELA